MTTKGIREVIVVHAQGRGGSRPWWQDVSIGAFRSGVEELDSEDRDALWAEIQGLVKVLQSHIESEIDSWKRKKIVRAHGYVLEKRAVLRALRHRSHNERHEIKSAAREHRLAAFVNIRTIAQNDPAAALVALCDYMCPEAAEFPEEGGAS